MKKLFLEVFKRRLEEQLGEELHIDNVDNELLQYDNFEWRLYDRQPVFVKNLKYVDVTEDEAEMFYNDYKQQFGEDFIVQGRSGGWWGFDSQNSCFDLVLGNDDKIKQYVDELILENLDRIAIEVEDIVSRDGEYTPESDDEDIVNEVLDYAIFDNYNNEDMLINHGVLVVVPTANLVEFDKTTDNDLLSLKESKMIEHLSKFYNVEFSEKARVYVVDSEGWGFTLKPHAVFDDLTLFVKHSKEEGRPFASEVAKRLDELRFYN